MTKYYKLQLLLFLIFLKMNYSIRSQCKNRANENAKLNIKYISNINTFKKKKSLILVDKQYGTNIHYRSNVWRE